MSSLILSQSVQDVLTVNSSEQAAADLVSSQSLSSVDTQLTLGLCPGPRGAEGRDELSSTWPELKGVLL